MINSVPSFKGVDPQYQQQSSDSGLTFPALGLVGLTGYQVIKDKGIYKFKLENAKSDSFEKAIKEANLTIDADVETVRKHFSGSATPPTVPPTASTVVVTSADVPALTADELGGMTKSKFSGLKDGTEIDVSKFFDYHKTIDKYRQGKVVPAKKNLDEKAENLAMEQARQNIRTSHSEFARGQFIELNTLSSNNFSDINELKVKIKELKLLNNDPTAPTPARRAEIEKKYSLPTGSKTGTASDPHPEFDAMLKSANDQQAEIDKKIAELLDPTDTTKGKIPEKKAALGRLKAGVADTDTRIGELEDEIKALEDQLDDLNAQNSDMPELAKRQLQSKREKLSLDTEVKNMEKEVKELEKAQTPYKNIKGSPEFAEYEAKIKDLNNKLTLKRFESTQAEAIMKAYHGATTLASAETSLGSLSKTALTSVETGSKEVANLTTEFRKAKSAYAEVEGVARAFESNPKATQATIHSKITEVFNEGVGTVAKQEAAKTGEAAKGIMPENVKTAFNNILEKLPKKSEFVKSVKEINVKELLTKGGIGLAVGIGAKLLWDNVIAKKQQPTAA